MLTLSRLADGIMDASSWWYTRPASAPICRIRRAGLHQRGKITRGLAAFAASPPDANKTDVVSIGLSCALGYLDWRKQVDWRPTYPILVDWLNRFTAHEPAFEHTRAKDA